MVPAAAVVLTSLSGQFAWHAELLFDLLPVRAGVDREALVADEVRGADDVLERLEDLGASRDVGALCLALARVVVPRLQAAATSPAPRVTAAFDGPRARAATLVSRDLADAVSDLESLLARLALGARAVSRGLEVAAQCEADLVAAGVGVGLAEPNGGRWG